MRIVFIGTVAFSVQTLSHLVASGADIVGVCTASAAPANSDYADLAEVADQNGIPWQYVSDVNAPETLEWIRERCPDVIFCFGWSKLLKRDLLQLAPKGVVGYHPAALPANRGRHPLIWALVLGLNNTASTFFFMDEGADSGDILSQKEIAIEDTDDAGSLYRKMTRTALEQLDEFVPLLAAGTHQRVAQDHGKASTWRKRGARDGLVDWRMAASSIHNLVRALARPYVGASFLLGNATIKVWKTVLVETDGPNIEPGKVLSVGAEGVVVKCGVGAIRLVETEPPLKIDPGAYL